MAESYMLSKCPSVMITQLQDNDSDDVIRQQSIVSVQRSVSLQVHRKQHPDRNNNARKMSHADEAGGSHFELANLLARAASFDAKFLRQLNEFETSERRLSVSSNTTGDVALASFVEVGGLGRAGSFVHLPDRYSQAAGASARRRTSVRRTSSSASPVVPSLGTVPECSASLGTVPECSATSPSDGSDVIDTSEMWRTRENDALAAMKWLRQEIRQLKQHDRILMRKLFELGTVIHQVNGGLQETVSCQTVDQPSAFSPSSQQSSLNSALIWRPYVESDDCIQTTVSQPKAVQRTTSSLQVDNPRAVSMIDVRPPADDIDQESRPPIKTNSLTHITSRASRLFSRLLPRTFRPSDRIAE